jgi:DNA-binding response OmpR family regulator
MCSESEQGNFFLSRGSLANVITVMDKGARRTILLVDDDEGMRAIVSEMLSRAGFDVLTANDGVEALRHFNSHRVDLAIVDVFMPRKDGLETLMEMRRNAPTAKLLVISGGGGYRMSRILLSVAHQLKADATLPKPFTRDELLAIVSKLLNG